MDNFEPVDEHFKKQVQNNQSVELIELSKKFPDGNVAVNNLNMSIFKGQITVVLGHNGAGKTTTIQMITGMIAETTGSIKIFGLDTANQLDEIRKFLGYCPQYDFLYDDLTVWEHFDLFSIFKQGRVDRQEIDRLINDFGLESKRNSPIKTLSGGQKRKVSTGLAFLANSKFIILDEPTSGMDPFSRR